MRCRCILGCVVGLVGLSGAARGEFLTNASQGVMEPGLTRSAPGILVNLDFLTPLRAAYPQFTTPMRVAELGVLFENITGTGSSLYLQPASSSTVLTLNMPVPGETVFTFYDPAWEDPALMQTPHAVLPQDWADELSDGVLSVRLWVDNGAALGSTQFLFTSMATVIMPDSGGSDLPEPSGLAGLGGMVLLMGRRRGQTTTYPQA